MRVHRAGTFSPALLMTTAGSPLDGPGREASASSSKRFNYLWHPGIASADSPEILGVAAMYLVLTFPDVMDASGSIKFVNQKMRQPANDPPSESPIATAIELQLCKHDLNDTEFRREYPAPTEWADFRIDIVLANSGRRVGIECDGASFHDEFRDELRDSLILGSGLVDTIWRLPGSAIHNHIHDCLFLISLYDDFLFDDRSRTVFMSQCSESARTHSPQSAESILLSVDRERLPNRGGFLDLRRRTRSDRYRPLRQHWRSLYDFALKHRGIRFSELHAIRLAEQSLI